MEYNQVLSLKHEIKTQNNRSQSARNFNNGVIFIDKHNNYERREERTYWFNKYLQDLQKRGISQKIVKRF